jgi:hypothetical protein
MSPTVSSSELVFDGIVIPPPLPLVVFGLFRFTKDCFRNASQLCGMKNMAFVPTPPFLEVFVSNNKMPTDTAIAISRDCGQENWPNPIVVAEQCEPGMFSKAGSYS